MQNYFNLETEVAHRRGEVERKIAAAAQHAQVRPKNGLTHWSRLTALTLEYLRSLATPQVPVACWNSRALRAATLEGGGATGT